MEHLRSKVSMLYHTNNSSYNTFLPQNKNDLWIPQSHVRNAGQFISPACVACART